MIIHHLDAAPLSLDPAQGVDHISQLVSSALREPLFVSDGTTFHLAAAASWRSSTDGRRHSFVLRDDGHWSDGWPVTADDFAYALGRALDPEYSPLAGNFGPLREIESSGNDLILELEHPVSDLPARLAAPLASPLPYHGARDITVSNGPLRYCGSGDRHITLEPNSYARLGLRARSGVQFVISKDLHGPVRDYATGHVDITCATWFPFDQLERWRGRRGLHQRPSPIHFVVVGNEERLGAWGRPAFRHALNDSVDRRAIANSLYGGIEPWGPPSAVPPGDVKQRAPSAQLLVPDYFPNLDLALQVADDWREAGLLDVVVEAVTFPEFASRWARADYELSLALLAPPYPSPEALLPALCWLAPSDSRHRLRAYASRLEREMSAVRRTNLHRQLGALLASSASFIPLARGRYLWLQRPSVRGYAIHSNGAFSFAGIANGTFD